MKKMSAAFILSAVMMTSFGLLAADAKCRNEDKAKDEPTALIALPTAVMAANIKPMNASEKQLVQSYITAQIASHGLTLRQFASLTPDQQRRILSPGRQFALSREERRAIMPSRIVVPETVTEQIAVNKAISADIIEEYAVPIPASISTGLNAPAGFRHVLIGDNLVLVSGNGVVMDVVNDIY